MRLETARPSGIGHLLGLRFDLLQAEHVGFFRGPKIEETFAED